MNVFDFDGVVSVGLCPSVLNGDIIVTGRGADESHIVESRLAQLIGEANAGLIPIYYNPITKKMGRTREDSGMHKLRTISKLIFLEGKKIETIFEDDAVQFDIIKKGLGVFFSSELPNLCYISSDWVNK